MCLYPTLIKNPKYRSTKKNDGIIPPIPDERVKYVPIGCQRCMECRQQKARAWQIRLLEDIKTNVNGYFITLTISNQQLQYLIEGKDTNGKQICEPLTTEGYAMDNQIATIATRRFLERWRKQYKKSLRHWLVTELGHDGTENIHIHGIIWTTQPQEQITLKWAYGHTFIGNYLNQSTINYVIKYITKQDEKHASYQSIILASPGIGNNYTRTLNSKSNKFNNCRTNETYRTPTGHKISLPIYWRNKIYTEQQREQLWLYKLDKNIRWIRGERISIKHGYNEYNNTLKWYQKINQRLGYGTNEISWNQEQYENQRRELLRDKRMLAARQFNIGSG